MILGVLKNSLKIIFERLNSSTINIVSVPLTGMLGSTNITVNEFLQLTEGDVITLDNSSDSPVKVFVEGQLFYTGIPGTIGKNRGILILDIIHKDVGNYE